MFILEKQYRYAINQECYEICAGLIEDGETPLAAAKHELLEETGYTGGEWFDYGVVSIDPSNMTLSLRKEFSQPIRKDWISLRI